MQLINACIISHLLASVKLLRYPKNLMMVYCFCVYALLEGLLGVNKNVKLFVKFQLSSVLCLVSFERVLSVIMPGGVKR